MNVTDAWEASLPDEDSAFPDCFLCGKPANHKQGGKLVCTRHPEGKVLWSKYAFAVRKLPNRFVYQGKEIAYVDFTKPNAPSAPA